jgi:hypothetical protein
LSYNSDGGGAYTKLCYSNTLIRTFKQTEKLLTKPSG